MEELKGEIQSTDQSYKNYQAKIKAELDEQKAFDILREQEKNLNGAIKKTVDELKFNQEEHARDTAEALTEISDLKKKLNEAEVDTKLSIQYLENSLAGAQSCRNRLHKKKETALKDEIETLKKQLSIEKLVH